ncbi:histidine phosphatase family protein [Nocardioides zeae]
MRLLLLRHGQTPANVAGQLDTAAPGLPLTELGRRQAAALVPALADEPVVGVYASDRTRAQETAAPLAADRDLDVVVLPGLGEIAAGDHEMGSGREAIKAYLTCIGGWMRGDLSGGMPGGEDGPAFHARFDGAVRAIVARHRPEDTVLAISHGAALRAWIATLLGGIDDDHPSSAASRTPAARGSRATATAGSSCAGRRIPSAASTSRTTPPTTSPASAPRRPCARPDRG